MSQFASIAIGAVGFGLAAAVALAVSPGPDRRGDPLDGRPGLAAGLLAGLALAFGQMAIGAGPVATSRVALGVALAGIAFRRLDLGLSWGRG